ncbi:MAG: hypothetical protein ABI336_12340 [Humibacillus sp.]
MLTGVDRPSALLSSDLAPTYVIGSLAELTQPYAAAMRSDGVWRCRAATAHLDGGHLVIDVAGGRPVEAVRAALAALLDRRAGSDRHDAGCGGGLPEDHLRSAVQVLDRLWAAAAPATRATETAEGQAGR